MTTKPLTNVIIKDGKVIRKKTYRAKQKKLAADREAKAWEKKGTGSKAAAAVAKVFASKKLKVVRKT